MSKILKRIICMIIISAFILTSFSAFAVNGQVSGFSDVPAGHWAEKDINDLRALGITYGIGNNKYGMGLTIKRYEFVTYLVRLMKWEVVKPATGSFSDIAASASFFAVIETAVKNGVVSKSIGKFRPEEPITREDMAIMLVKALGYDNLSSQLSDISSTFTDVSRNVSYITMAKDFGIIKGTDQYTFKPYNTAKREEAAAMMMRMYNRLEVPLKELHAFYAIRSYNQINMINNLDLASFGWSRLEYDAADGKIVLNTSSSNSNEYALPTGFSEPFNKAVQNNASKQLMVTVKNDTIAGTDGGAGVPVLEYILTKPEIRRQVIAAITGQVNSTSKDGINISFDGVVIDFEGMKGTILKNSFNEFIKELRVELDKPAKKKLYVAVHPVSKPGQAYFNAYDYRTIGEYADKIILMAHDYNATKLTAADMQNGYTITPLSPIDYIYYALEAITDQNTGVLDASKIWLQLSFNTVQWKLKDGKVINEYPYHPGYEDLQKRLLTDVTINFGNSRNPNVTFIDSTDGTKNVIWYEDSRSVQAKIDLAKMFGINGISLWRLGTIPDYAETAAKKIYLNVWQQILSNF